MSSSTNDRQFFVFFMLFCIFCFRLEARSGGYGHGYAICYAICYRAMRGAIGCGARLYVAVASAVLCCEPSVTLCLCVAYRWSPRVGSHFVGALTTNDPVGLTNCLSFSHSHCYRLCLTLSLSYSPTLLLSSSAVVLASPSVFLSTAVSASSTFVSAVCSAACRVALFSNLHSPLA